MRNTPGFSGADWLEAALGAILMLLAFTVRGRLLDAGKRFAARPVWCMVVLALLPVALRMLLLGRHPVPLPQIYDEFGHLLVADTLRHFRLANAPHPMARFFETFFVLQAPTYSSIYPPGQGLLLAAGKAVSGSPWVGVIAATATFCSLTYWMLAGWVSRGWALTGGLLAVMEFGPLSQWMNSYWGGALAAAAGCLVFGALPRLRARYRLRDALLLGAGFGVHLITRPYESLFLGAAVLIFASGAFRWFLKPMGIAALAALPAVILLLMQNHAVTREWLRLPYSVSQEQYGVPAALTFQKTPVPHRELTREQQLDYRMQTAFRGPGAENVASYLERMIYRIRYYRFFFYAPLYVAIAAFLFGMRERRWAYVALTCLLFALGCNFFPAFQFHYVAAIACLFVLICVAGLERLGEPAARFVLFLCVAQFVVYYTCHLFEDTAFARALLPYETWDVINHRGSQERRLNVERAVQAAQGNQLVFVRYWPGHLFQDEWVYNEADPDGARIVWARDRGEEEDALLRNYYPDRRVWLLEPDARPPRLTAWEK